MFLIGLTRPRFDCSIEISKHAVTFEFCWLHAVGMKGSLVAIKLLKPHNNPFSMQTFLIVLKGNHSEGRDVRNIAPVRFLC